MHFSAVKEEFVRMEDYWDKHRSNDSARNVFVGRLSASPTCGGYDSSNEKEVLWGRRIFLENAIGSICWYWN